MTHVRGAAPGRPVVLFGHSMGGLVAALWVAERGAGGLAGLVLSSAALHTFPVPRLLAKAAPYVARWRPQQVVTRLDLSKLSHDGAVERGLPRGRAEHTSRASARASRSRSCAPRSACKQRAHAFTLPLYLFHGTADTVTPPGGSEWLAVHAPSADVTLRLYDGLYHETMKEPERDAVIADVADWIVAHTAHA